VSPLLPAGPAALDNASAAATEGIAELSSYIWHETSSWDLRQPGLLLLLGGMWIRPHLFKGLQLLVDAD